MLVLLTGNNSYQLKQELHALIDKFVSEHTDMGLERLDGEEVAYDRMREAVESLPFLASKKMVVLDKPSSNKEFLDKAPDLLGSVGDEIDVVLVEPKPDKRTAYYKFLKKQAEIKEFKDLDERGLAQWLSGLAKEKGGKMSQTDAKYLVERVGTNQMLLANELEKLLAYDKTVAKDSINLLTEPTPQSSIFELLDAAMAGKTKQALKLYDEQRAMRVEPQQIIAMLGWQLHILALVKAAGKKDPREIAKEAKLNPFVVRKSLGLARNMSMNDIKKLVKDTLGVDIRLKSESIDADDALKNLIMTLG